MMKNSEAVGHHGDLAPLTVPDHWNEKWEHKPDISYLRNLRWIRRYLYQQLHREFLNSLPVDESKKFLEVGCGSGRWLVYFHKQFRYDVHGIDYSLKAVELTQEVLSIAKVPAKVLCSSMEDDDLDMRYDVVFSDGFLEHFKRPEAVLAKLFSFVKPGGTLITIVPNLTGFHRSCIRRFGHEERIFKTHRTVTRQQLLDWYQALGCENTRCLFFGSILPKVYPLPGVITKPLNVVIRMAALAGIAIEGESVSSTYLASGTKPL